MAHAPAATATAGPIAYHRVYLQEQQIYQEVADQAQWGYWYYATTNTTGLTHQSAADQIVRQQFINNGFLTDTEDTNFRAINNAYPVFGFAVDMGTVSTETVSRVWTLSLNQNDAVQFEGTTGNASIPGLWRSYFTSDLDAVAFFYNDWAATQIVATNLDNQVIGDSIAAAGENYLTLTSLAFRQAFGSIKLCGNQDNPYIFLKEISSDGNVNTVDVIFPFFPLLLYSNATMLRLLLEPLFINQAAGWYPNRYAMHDLGAHYPNATGHNDGMDEMQPLEECGNMIIMTLAYAQRTGDNAFLSQYYNLLLQWNNYLVEEALIPALQISTGMLRPIFPLTPLLWPLTSQIKPCRRLCRQPRQSNESRAQGHHCHRSHV